MSDVREIIIQLARPGGKYPDGLVEHGWYFTEGGKVFLCDKRGTRTGVSKIIRANGETAEEVARRLLKGDTRSRSRFSDFNRPLHYPKGY
jgi:hypothetical protein